MSRKVKVRDTICLSYDLIAFPTVVDLIAAPVRCVRKQAERFVNKSACRALFQSGDHNIPDLDVQPARVILIKANALVLSIEVTDLVIGKILLDLHPVLSCPASPGRGAGY